MILICNLKYFCFSISKQFESLNNSKSEGNAADLEIFNLKPQTGCNLEIFGV